MSGQLLTLKQVASRLSVSVAFVRDHTNNRRQPTIPNIKIGSVTRVREEALEHWLKEQERSS